MSRVGKGLSLSAFGVEAPTIVREPARDRHDRDLKACPECGRPVGEPSTWRIQNPDVEDDADVDTLVTRAYACEAHSYDVILPVPVAEGAPSLGDTWATVRVRYSDTGVRHVAVPKTEVSR